MESSNKTLIERLGFSDPDRKRIKHDEIQIWVYKNFRTVLSQALPLLPINEFDKLELQLEYPVLDERYNNKNYVVGFIDIYCKRLAIGVEVKSDIPIVGDVIRQMQFYRRYKSGSWIVVSPDDRYSDILKEQGIHFFKYQMDSFTQLELFQ